MLLTVLKDCDGTKWLLGKNTVVKCGICRSLHAVKTQFFCFRQVPVFEKRFSCANIMHTFVIKIYPRSILLFEITRGLCWKRAVMKIALPGISRWALFAHWEWAGKCGCAGSWAPLGALQPLLGVCWPGVGGNGSGAQRLLQVLLSLKALGYKVKILSSPKSRCFWKQHWLIMIFFSPWYSYIWISGTMTPILQKEGNGRKY